MNNREHYNYRILSKIDSGKPITQRSLAKELGIALGLTNLLLKRLIKKGYLKTRAAITGRRLKYLLTPTGISEKARLSRVYLENTINLYTETRDKIRASLLSMAAEVEDRSRARRIIFFGAGDVCEIAYIALNNSKFELVGVVDDHKQGQSFFGYRINSPQELLKEGNGNSFDYVVVTTFRKADQVRMRLRALQVPPEKVFFL